MGRARGKAYAGAEMRGPASTRRGRGWPRAACGGDDAPASGGLAIASLWEGVRAQLLRRVSRFSPACVPRAHHPIIATAGPVRSERSPLSCPCSHVLHYYCCESEVLLGELVGRVTELVRHGVAASRALPIGDRHCVGQRQGCAEVSEPRCVLVA